MEAADTQDIISSTFLLITLITVLRWLQACWPEEEEEEEEEEESCDSAPEVWKPVRDKNKRMKKTSPLSPN